MATSASATSVAAAMAPIGTAIAASPVVAATTTAIAVVAAITGTVAAVATTTEDEGGNHAAHSSVGCFRSTARRTGACFGSQIEAAEVAALCQQQSVNNSPPPSC